MHNSDPNPEIHQKPGSIYEDILFMFIANVKKGKNITDIPTCVITVRKNQN